LHSFLDRQSITYYSADLSSGHDYQFDLEKEIPLASHSFDYVVALDVLEHIENSHQAFRELARLSRQSLIIALPNMATLPRRWSFLWRGNLGTGKYDLQPEHQGDRHRWLTVYPEINNFVEVNSVRANMVLDVLVEQLETGFVTNWAAFFVTSLGFCRNGLFTGRCIYTISKW